MGLLSPLDLIVIASYLAGITIVGLRFYRSSSNMDEYLVGNQGMKWFPVALSILAADTSALTYLGYAGWSFRHDLKYSQIVLGYLVAVPIVIWLFLPIYSRRNIYTAYQYLETRFGLPVRLFGTFSFLVTRGAHVAIIIYAPALVIGDLMGVPLKVSIPVMGLLTALYTAMGGIKSVIWTDAIQVGMVCLGLGILTVSALSHLDGGIASVWVIGHQFGKFQYFDFSVNFDKVDNFWAMLAGSTVLAVQAMSTDQAVLQKYFTTKSKAESTKSLLFYGAVTVPLIYFLSLLGVVLFVFYQQHPLVNASLKSPDAVVAHYAAEMLPHGLAGLVVASIFAGSMSTVSASLNSLATSSVVDVYQRLIRRHQSDRHYTMASRVATFGWGLIATAGAFYAGRLGALILAYHKIASLLGGVVLGVFLLGILSTAVGTKAVLFGAVGGLGVVGYVSRYTTVSLYWYCIIGLITTLAAGWLFSLFQPATLVDG